MATFFNTSTTYLLMSASTSKFLNRYGTGTPANQQNVNVWAPTGTTDQHWKFIRRGGNNYQLALAMGNFAYGLDYYWGASNKYNCDINTLIGNTTDSTMTVYEIVSNNTPYVKFQMTAYPDYYLTTMDNGDVRWTSDLGTYNTKQLWYLCPVLSGGSAEGNTGGTLTVGQRPPDLDYTKQIYQTGNLFNNEGGGKLVGQCTWHAWGRMKEKTGKAIVFSSNTGRHAKNWLSLTKDTCMHYNTNTPVTNSVAVYSGGEYGHVAFVEKVESNGTVYVTDANIKKPYNNGSYKSSDGLVTKLNKATIKNFRGKTLLGFLTVK